MDTITVTVEVPVLSRGKNAHGDPITNEKIVQTISYVLNHSLQRGCQYIGAPKFGPISANGIVHNEGIGVPDR
jgi:hypothetical protein